MGSPDANDVLDDAIVIPGALNVILGAWLVVSPFLLDCGLDDPIADQVAGGAAIAVLACLGAVRAGATALVSWANGVLGAVVFAFALLSPASPQVAVNHGVCGALVCVLAVMSALSARE
jgi:hypothetical protein